MIKFFKFPVFSKTVLILIEYEKKKFIGKCVLFIGKRVQIHQLLKRNTKYLNVTKVQRKISKNMNKKLKETFVSNK